MIGENDLHLCHGRFCYEKLRHSLCHGWASGPAAFIQEYILGVKILEPGCKKLKIEPNLGDLEFIRGGYPTPYGVVEISAHKNNEKTVTQINAPLEITIVKGDKSI